MCFSMKLVETWIEVDREEKKIFFMITYKSLTTIPDLIPFLLKKIYRLFEFVAKMCAFIGKHTDDK